MATKRVNQAGYVSKAELWEGCSAFYYSEKAGTPTSLMPTWATVSRRQGTSNGYTVALWVYEQPKVSLDVVGEAFARKVARAHAKVTGDGQRFCWGIDHDRKCSPGTKMVTKQEIEQGYCKACATMLTEDVEV